MGKILEAIDLCKYFDNPGGVLHAVEGLNFFMEENTTLGVVGESGCGKTTLGRVIMGLHSVTSGHVFFNGIDITNPSRVEKKKLHMELQMIFQDPYSSLDPRMSLSDLIAEPLRAAKIYRSKSDRNRRIAELMDTVGLARRSIYSYPHELDGGRRQRIGIARALALDPKFIVCDEPVSALDVSIQAQILNLLQDLQREKGLTYIFITHNLSVVKHISHTIMVMYLGCEVEMCESKQLFRQPLHPYTKGLLAAIPIPSIHVKQEETILSGEVTSPINPAPGCRFASRCLYARDKCKTEFPAVEEVLPHHYCACHFVSDINGL